jgi:hypothetical protein
MRKSYFSISILLLLLSANAVIAGNGKIRHNNKPVPGDYIVKLSSSLSPGDVQRLADRFASAHHGHIKFVYGKVLPGFAISGITDAEARKISADPLVDLVEEDTIVTAAAVPVQSPAPWHLDRLDQRQLPLDGNYYQDCAITRDAVIYIVDSGVRASHQEFWTSSTDHTSRVLPGHQLSAFDPLFGTAEDPCDYYTACDWSCLLGGHGTAVASVAAGLTYGVAKTAKIVPVRVLDCAGRGQLSQVIEGLSWIDSNPLPEHGVVNMSFTYADSDGQTGAFESAIDTLVNSDNLTVVVAAGNFGTSVDHITPARHSRANGGTVITVGGTNNQDHPWKCNSANSWEDCDPINTVGTDWGPGIDIFAPSQNISSASIRDPATGLFSDTMERQQARSGTSFAAPMVAGLAARYLQTTGLVNPTPAQVWSYIQGVASGDSPSTPPAVLSDGTDANSGALNGSPNRLVYGPFATRCNN